jgi:hypothetical protein
MGFWLFLHQNKSDTACAHFWGNRNSSVQGAKTAGKIAGWANWRPRWVTGTKTAFVRR